MTAAPDVARLLRSTRRRVLAQSMFHYLGVALMSAVAILIVTSAYERWFQPPAWRTEALLIGAGMLVIAAVAQSFRRAPTPAGLGQELDRLGGTHDRLTTALAFAAQPESPIRTLALAECASYLRGKDFRALLPWRVPAAWRWLAVPVIALALLRWDIQLAEAARAGRLAEAQEQASPTVEALRALARDLEADAKKTGDEELEKLAAEIARRAEKLRAAATDRTEAEKAALRELSGLEQLAEEMKRSPSRTVTQQELQALAAALEKAEATRAAAEKMKAGDLASAAEALERAAARAESQGEQSDEAKAEAALKQALQRLAEQKQISETVQRQLSPAPGSAEESALRQLADLLRKLPQAPGGKPGKSQGSPQSLENLLAALQNLKAGKGQPPGKNADSNTGPPQDIQISRSPNTAGPPAGQISIPGSNPGGEKDTGTTDSPFSPHRQESAKKGADLAVQGQQTDQGDSFSQMMPGGLDASRSTRQYKKLYETLAPAAESAVLQEDIPLGSRLFIRRYFESIRPAE
jgi:hypothetical protein